jgi:hypothetical protein
MERCLSAGAKRGLEAPRFILVRAMDGWLLSIHSIATIAPDRLGYSINQNLSSIYSVQWNMMA